jgi:hypothetical protein
MPKHTRFTHLKGVFGPWWIAVNGLWTLASSADVLVGHYASASFKAAWDAAWIAPKWGWTVWVIGFLLITVGSAFEYSFRYIRQHENESAQRETHLQTELAEYAAENKRLATLSQATADPFLSLLEKRRKLEAELQPLLKIEEYGIKVIPAVKIGKDEGDYRREQIERLKRDITEIGRQLSHINSTVTAFDWKALKKDFQELPGRIRANWQRQSDHTEFWTLLHPACRELCTLAGTMLVKSPKVSAALPQKISAELDPMYRWLSLLKEKQPIKIDHAYETGPNGGHQGIILSGSIEDVKESSSVVCTGCAAIEL